MPVERAPLSGMGRRPGAALVALACAGLAAGATAQTAADGTLDHLVERGDTLIGLHARLMSPQADWRVVQRLNRIADPRRLQPGSTLRIPLALLREEAVNAEVLHRHGEVFVERAGAAPEPLPAAALLRSGDVIITGAQSSASLRFADGSRALLGPGARLRVERHVRRGTHGSGGVDTLLRMDGGGIETRVPPTRPAPRFELRTPVVNLGVRGTEFRARLDGARLLTEVLQGRVAVGTTPLAAGYGTVASAGRVATPQPLPAAPDLAALPTRVERLPLNFGFAAAGSAARYRAQVFDATGEGRLVLEGLFDTPQANWPDTPPDGRYELRVRAADASGVEGHAATLAFTLKARPEPPFQIKPRGGDKLLSPNVAFAWSAHPEATGYRLQVAATPDFAAPVIDRGDLTGTELRGSLPAGTWYWRLATVRAGNDAGPWGDGVAFERIDPPPVPPAPAVEPPQAGDAGLVVRWAATPTAGARYQVQVARDAAFTQPVVDQTTTATEWLVPRPEPGSYHVRVRHVAPDGRVGDFGAAQRVEIPGTRWWLWLLPVLLLL